MAHDGATEAFGKVSDYEKLTSKRTEEASFLKQKS